MTAPKSVAQRLELGNAAKALAEVEKLLGGRLVSGPLIVDKELFLRAAAEMQNIMQARGFSLPMQSGYSEPNFLLHGETITLNLDDADTSIHETIDAIAALDKRLAEIVEKRWVHF